mgnify:CR=1 FL=1
MAAKLAGLSVALLLMTSVASHAQRAPEPIRYTVRFPAPQSHYAEVTAEVPTNRRPDVDLMMAVWTPGSYLVREYARNVESVTARGQDGRALTIDKSRKNPLPRVITALGIETSATHMEWFFGPKGLKFSEIGCRPPGVRAWDNHPGTPDKEARIWLRCSDLSNCRHWVAATESQATL